MLLCASMLAHADNFFMPAEWTAQAAVWLSWPVADSRHWGGAKWTIIEQKFAEIAATISHQQLVCINAAGPRHACILSACAHAGADFSQVQLWDHHHNDVWCRDHGPIFVKHRQTGEVAVTDWGFNAWGGKFAPWDLDDAIPRRVAESLQMRCFSREMILEGGAIEVNGCGLLLTTEAVLLNPNRNPQLGRQQIEAELRAGLGVEEICWLPGGIEGDDTDGHIDDLARFVSEDVVLACIEDDRSSPNHDILEKNWHCLSEFRRASGAGLELVPMPMPQACEVPGWRLPVLPASYVNFLILNEAVLVPQFRQAKADDHACGLLRELFPSRRVVGIDCLDLVEEGGTLHCISQQQPRAGW